MKSHYDLTNAEFELQFDSCKLDSNLFSHEAHLRLAWIHITKYGIEKALINIQSQLTRYVTHVGESTKYNKTVTVAAIKAVHHFILKSKSDNFMDFIAEFPRLQNNFKGLMDRHYGVDIFKSAKARKEFISPDLLPFD